MQEVKQTQKPRYKFVDILDYSTANVTIWMYQKPSGKFIYYLVADGQTIGEVTFLESSKDTFKVKGGQN